MMNSLKAVFLLVTAGCLMLASAQFEYLNEPALLWNGIVSDAFSGVGERNGVFMSPDGAMLVSVASDATLRAYNPLTGEVLWTYVPSNFGLPVTSFGGVTFNYQAATPFLVYAVADGVVDLADTSVAQSRIIAVDRSGTEIFQSIPLPGVVAGTPVTDFDGIHVLATHNENGLKGYLSIFFLGSIQSPLSPVFSGGYQATSADGNTTAGVERPFSPIGFYHNPIEGWYDGGEGNTNDIFIFAWDTPSTASAINDGDGQSFVAQFPITYANDGQGLGFVPFGSATDFHAITPPVLTNQGLSMYWSVTKGNQDCYIGEFGLARTKFSRGRSGRVDGFERADRPFPAYQSARASPTLSSGTDQPTVYGVAPNAQLWSMDYQYTESSLVIVATEDIVSSKLLLTGNGEYIVYATQAVLQTNGSLTMLDSANLNRQAWTLIIPGGVEGDIAMNPKGTTVYVASAIGEIFAYQFANDSTPTSAPTTAPSQLGSPAPTTASPTAMPNTAAPAGSPTATPTSSGAPTITAGPTTEILSEMPSDVPSFAPTFPPSSSMTTGQPVATTTTEAPIGENETGMPVAPLSTSSPTPLTTSSPVSTGSPLAAPTGGAPEPEAPTSASAYAASLASVFLACTIAALL